MRTVREIAREIFADWKKVNYAALPYLEAMLQIENINDNYGADSGKNVVIYFLSNAASWRGENARRIKKELAVLIKS